mgnify:CR=1 FL=1
MGKQEENEAVHLIREAVKAQAMLKTTQRHACMRHTEEALKVVDAVTSKMWRYLAEVDFPDLYGPQPPTDTL